MSKCNGREKREGWIKGIGKKHRGERIDIEERRIKERKKENAK